MENLPREYWRASTGQAFNYNPRKPRLSSGPFLKNACNASLKKWEWDINKIGRVILRAGRGDEDSSF